MRTICGGSAASFWIRRKRRPGASSNLAAFAGQDSNAGRIAGLLPVNACRSPVQNSTSPGWASTTRTVAGASAASAATASAADEPQAPSMVPAPPAAATPPRRRILPRAQMRRQPGERQPPVRDGHGPSVKPYHRCTPCGVSCHASALVHEQQKRDHQCGAAGTPADVAGAKSDCTIRSREPAKDSPRTRPSQAHFAVNETRFAQGIACSATRIERQLRQSPQCRGAQIAPGLI